MTFKDWLNIVNDKGLICDRYLPAVMSARSRKQYMDAVLDINGMTFLCDMMDAGYGLPYETIKAEFAPYLNGRYIGTNRSASGAYTTSMYCDINTPSEITVNTSLAGIFGCSCYIHIPDNTRTRLCVDGGSNIMLTVGKGAKCHIDVWGDGIVCHGYDDDTVVIKHKKYKANE